MITVHTREDFLIKLSKLLPANPVCAEIGVLHGDFSRLILDIIKPKHIDLIDPYSKSISTYDDGLNTAYSTLQDYKAILKRFYPEMLFRQVSIYREYSYVRVKNVSDDTFDFIYHDACHLYKDVAGDLNDWLPKLKAGGVMAGHDYVQLQDFGVIQAVDEFCAKNGFEMIIFNDNGGDYALRRVGK